MIKKLCCVFALLVASSAFSYSIPSQKNTLKENENTKLLAKISAGLSSIASQVEKGIVFVSISKTFKASPFGMMDPFEFFFGPQFPGGRGGRQQQQPEFKQEGLGSGFIVDLDKGYVLTNNHVIDEADEIHLKLANGATYPGKVLGRDKNTDIAVVQIKDNKFNKRGIAALPLGNSDSVSVGELCVAMGAPFGLEASLTFGIVSAVGRGSLSVTELGNFMQTDAAINPGNSGGPLLNTSGEVIGINTAIYSKSGGYNGIGFTIPANLAKLVAEQLINEGEIQRGYLGVFLGQELDQELMEDMKLPKGTTGALVSGVEPGSPADKGGLEAGDIITKIDNRNIKDFQELRNMVGLMKPRSKISVTYYRNGSQKNTTITLGNFKSDGAQGGAAGSSKGQESSEFGVQISNVTSALKSTYGFTSRSGAVITNISPNSPAGRSGLKVGDVIVKVNNTNIGSPKDFFQATKKKTRLLLRVERAGQFLFIPVKK